MSDSENKTARENARFDMYIEMLANSGLQSVHNWKLPNDDSRFDDTAAADEFEATADKAFRATLAAIDAIGSADAERKRTRESD